MHFVQFYALKMSRLYPILTGLKLVSLIILLFCAKTLEYFYEIVQLLSEWLYEARDNLRRPLGNHTDLKFRG